MEDLSVIYKRIELLMKRKGITKYEMAKRIIINRGKEPTKELLRSTVTALYTTWGKSRAMSIFIEYAKALEVNLWEFYISKDDINKFISMGVLLDDNNNELNGSK